VSHYLGIEIGGTKLQLVLGDSAGIIQQRRKLTVNKEEGAHGIRKQIERTLPELMGGTILRGAGVGFGGPVDWKTGRICRSHQIEGWSEFNLAGWLQPQVNAPVVVDNDANVAALGEAKRGTGAGFDPVFYVTLGSGVGGGLVSNGVIVHGATPGEAEIGHVRLDRAGLTIESRCSGWAVDERIRKLQAEQAVNPHSGTSVVTGGEARLLAAAIAADEKWAVALLAELAEDLAFGLSHVVHLYHPEIIILGGGLSGIGEPLRAAVEQELRRFIMEAFHPGPRIALTALGEDAVPAGALELARVSPR
jgi:glucokinase